MSICVCAKCKNPWGASGSPARCPYCGQVSFAIAIQPTLSTAMKKCWQNPEYRAKQSAAHKGKHFTAEIRARMSDAAKGRLQNPEYRAKQSAAHRGKDPTAETRAKISAALTQVREDRDSRGRFIKGNMPWNKKRGAKSND